MFFLRWRKSIVIKKYRSSWSYSNLYKLPDLIVVTKWEWANYDLCIDSSPVGAAEELKGPSQVQLLHAGCWLLFLLSCNLLSEENKQSCHSGETKNGSNKNECSSPDDMNLFFKVWTGWRMSWIWSPSHWMLPWGWLKLVGLWMPLWEISECKESVDLLELIWTNISS